MVTELAGIVLAGGKSRRFGKDKALYMFNNRTFFEHALYNLKAVSDVTAVIGRANQRNEASLYLTDDEVYREKGPLAGLYTAMKEVKADWYLVIACDMPLVDQEILTEILLNRTDNHEAVIPVIHGKIHPLIALYRQTVLPEVESLLAKGNLKMMSLIEKIDAVYLDESHFKDSNRFANINQMEDLKILREYER